MEEREEGMGLESRKVLYGQVRKFDLHLLCVCVCVCVCEVGGGGGGGGGYTITPLLG